MQTEKLAIFEAERPALLSIAYRMIGERTRAEDLVQDTWLRWQAVEQDDIRSKPAWLRTVLTRLAIDYLKSAQRQREHYVGPWLPEPLVDTDAAPTPEDAWALAKDCELALLWAMERLTPTERSVFILRSAFDTEFSEIADTIGTSAQTCRKTFSRAKQKIQDSKLRYTASNEATEKMMQQFGQACVAQSQEDVLRLLAPDVIALSDGGGRVRAALRPLHGPAEVAQVMLSVSKKYVSADAITFAQINKQPGCQIRGTENNDMVCTIHLNAEGLIDWIYILRNPDKLPALTPTARH